MIVDTLFIELAPRGPAASLCGAHLPLSVVTAVRFERSPFPQEPAGVRAPPRRAGELLRVLLMPNRYRVIFYSLEEVSSSSYSSFSSASSSISAVFFFFFLFFIFSFLFLHLYPHIFINSGTPSPPPLIPPRHLRILLLRLLRIPLILLDLPLPTPPPLILHAPPFLLLLRLPPPPPPKLLPLEYAV